MKAYTGRPAARFLIRTAIVAGAYFLVLYPSQLLLPLLPGTEVRPAAFIPVVAGIVWGWPAALGVFLSNLLSDTLVYPASFDAALIGSIANGLAAVCARRCYFAIPRARQGEYIYHLRSLLRYLFACAVTQLALCAVIAQSLQYYSAALPQSVFPMLFLNNMESCILLGLPVMLFVPLFMPGEYPQKDRGGGRYALFVLPAIILEAALLRSSPSSGWILSRMLLCLVLLAIFDVFAPEMKPKEDKHRFSTLRSKCFRTVMVTAEILSLLFCAIVILTLSPYVPEKLMLWQKSYMISAVVLTIMTLAFSVIIGIFQEKIATPLYRIARDIRTDDHADKNDMEVLRDRLNFIAQNADPLNGNEFVLYIGLTTRTGENSFSYAEARAAVDAICLRIVSGYISSLDAVGGYRGREASVTEKTLKYTIFGASDEQIRTIAEEVGAALEQESILVEKNRTARYYYYPKKNTL